MALDVTSAVDVAAVEAAIGGLYGGPLPEASGVLHVVAVAPEVDDLRVIRINEEAPKSPTDFFLLNLTRARVDGIVVTGAILRDEADLTYDLQGPGRSSEGLSAYRRAVARRAGPPLLLILTRGHHLPEDHPAYHSWAEPVVFTSERAVPPLRRTLPARVDVVGDPSPSLASALAYLERRRACRAVSVEAGPSVAADLYRSGGAPSVDELLLSEFEGQLAPGARGRLLGTRSAVLGPLTPAGGPTAVEEDSGPWRFSRHVRRAP
ncbi:MAG: hypothetical protein ACFCGT_22400 [Sandaracinaceae bacterium]